MDEFTPLLKAYKDLYREAKQIKSACRSNSQLEILFEKTDKVTMAIEKMRSDVILNK